MQLVEPIPPLPTLWLSDTTWLLIAAFPPKNARGSQADSEIRTSWNLVNVQASEANLSVFQDGVVVYFLQTQCLQLRWRMLDIAKFR